MGQLPPQGKIISSYWVSDLQLLGSRNNSSFFKVKLFFDEKMFNNLKKKMITLLDFDFLNLVT
jgi:hypothetical protein